MLSKRIEQIVKRHTGNALLNTPSLLITQQSHKDLSVDQLPYPVDEEIIDSATNALEEGQTHYVDVPGILPLREALADHLTSEFSLDKDRIQIVVTAGVQESRFLTLQILGNQHGKIGVPQVVHPGVRRAIGVRPFEVMEIPTIAANGYLPSMDEVKNSLDKGCKLLYLESPVRLTGAVYSKEEIKLLTKMIQDYEATVIWDQGLAPWVMEKRYTSLASQKAIADHVVVLGEAWPGTGIEGWFVGYIATPQKWFDAIRSQKQILSICTSTASQYGALGAAKVYAEKHGLQLKQLAMARQNLMTQINSTNVYPVPGHAANLLAVHVPQENQAEFAQKLQDEDISLADGGNFGAPNIYRLLVTLDDSIIHALNQLN